MRALAAIFDGFVDPVLVYEPFEVVYANPAFIRVYGAQSLQRAQFPFVREELERAVLAAGSEVRLLQSDPAEHFAVHSCSRLELEGRTGTLLLLRNIAENRRLRAEILGISRRENERLAGELHDGIGQELAGIALQLEPLVRSLDAASAAEATPAAAILQSVMEVGKSIRKMAHALAPAVERETLGALLRKLSLEASSKASVSCICRVKADPPLPPPIVLNLHRIAREAVTNARRHGQAREIVITLETDGPACILTVKDNGTGLPQELAGSGIGLRLMDYRAHEINGQLSLEKLPGGEGTLVRCAVPLPNATFP